MTATTSRAVVRRGSLSVKVKPRANPGRKLFRQVTSKTNPRQVEQMDDLELLTVLLGERAATTIVSQLKDRGGLKAFHTLGESGPRALLVLPGVDEANAARLLVLFEVSARISEPFRE